MLSPKQICFCENYVVDLNATQAAIRAGYSVKTAASQAERLLRNVDIQEYIQVLQSKLSEKTEITAIRVLEELAKIAFCNAQDFVNGGNSILEIKHLPRDKAAAVSKIKTTLKENGDLVSEIQFHSKPEALDKLSKHLGLYEANNRQKQPQINVSSLSPTDLKSLLEIKKSLAKK